MHIPATKFDAWAEPEVPVRFSPLLFLLFCVAALWVNYPGRLNMDSYAQLLQIYDPTILNDFFPPVVTLLWNVFEPIAGQPGSALTVQCLLFAFFASVLPAYRKIDRRTLLLLAVETGFRIALVGLAGVVFNDATLAALLLAMIACLQLMQRSRRKLYYLIATMLLLVLALQVRPTSPVIFAAAWAIVSLTFFSSARAYLVALAVATIAMMAVPPIGDALGRSVADVHSTHPEKQVIVFDAAGISKYSGGDAFQEWRGWPKTGLPAPASCYQPRLWDSFSPWGRCHRYSETFDRVADMKLESPFVWWIGIIARHPVAYLDHRLAYARKIFLSPNSFIKSGRQTAVTNSREEQAMRERYHAHQRGAENIAFWQDNFVSLRLLKITEVVFAKPKSFLVAMLICFMVVVWNIRKYFSNGQVDPVLLSVAALGIGNAAMFAFLGCASEGRYLLPTTCCGYVALLMLLRAWAARGHGQNISSVPSRHSITEAEV